MHPTLLKARQSTAATETAAAVASIDARLDRVEAKLDELLRARDAEPRDPKPPKGK